MLSQQLPGCFVLRKNMIKAMQHLPEKCAIPFEVNMIGPEIGRDQHHRNMTLGKGFEVMMPDLIFDKKHKFWLHCGNKLFCIAPGIKRQVKDEIGSCIMLPDLISRW